MHAHDPYTSLEAARQLILAHRPELAERELRRLLALHPHDAHAHALLAWCLVLQERGGEALDQAAEAVRLEPDWSYPHFILAEVHLALGQPKEAEASARAALELEPTYAAYHASLAAALLNQGERKAERKALRVAEMGLSHDADDVACARLRAHALSRLQRHDEARQAAAYALRLGPDLSETHAAAGWIELTAGKTDRAGELLRQAVRLDPGNDHARKGLRMATRGQRYAASLLLQARRWAWPLRIAAVAVVAQVAYVASRKGAGALPFPVIYSLILVTAVVGAMLWTHRRHPHIVEEMRLAGADGPEAREARRTLAFLVVLLFFVLTAAVLDGPRRAARPPSAAPETPPPPAAQAPE